MATDTPAYPGSDDSADPAQIPESAAPPSWGARLARLAVVALAIGVLALVVFAHAAGVVSPGMH